MSPHPTQDTVSRSGAPISEPLCSALNPLLPAKALGVAISGESGCVEPSEEFVTSKGLWCCCWSRVLGSCNGALRGAAGRRSSALGALPDCGKARHLKGFCREGSRPGLLTALASPGRMSFASRKGQECRPLPAAALAALHYPGARPGDLSPGGHRRRPGARASTRHIKPHLARVQS